MIRPFNDFPPKEGWFGTPPKHWDVVKTKVLFRNSHDRKFDGDEQLSATQKYGVIPQRLYMEQEDTRVMLALSGTENFKHVDQDDFVISLRSFEGGIERCFYDGCVSPAYTVMKSNVELSPGYFQYLFKSRKFIEEMHLGVYGIRDGKAVNFEDVARIQMPFPPLDEQLAIADYLDTETKRIDGLIEEKLKLKELLIELRATTISEAILGGEKSKDGQASIQWEKTRLKYFASMQSGNAITSEFIEDEGEYPVYGGNGLRGYTREYTHEGDHILIGRQGALCGNVHLVQGRYWASEHAVVVTLYKGDNSRWAQYLLGQMNLGQYSIASAQPGLAVDRIKELEVLRPPVEEQLAIAKHLDEETKRIDELVAHVNSEIELLKELRSSTITDAVLGRIDIRQATTH